MEVGLVVEHIDVASSQHSHDEGPKRPMNVDLISPWITWFLRLLDKYLARCEPLGYNIYIAVNAHLTLTCLKIFIDRCIYM